MATSEVYLGQATTISGTPVSTPTTNPATAPTALTGDNLVTQVARELDVSPSRVRDGVEVTAPRAPGGAVGNQPTIATVTFTDESQGRRAARRGPLRGGDPRAGARELGRDRRHLRGGGGPLVGAGRPPGGGSRPTAASSPRTRAASRRSSSSRSCRAPASSSRWPPPSSRSSASTWSRSASTASRTSSLAQAQLVEQPAEPCAHRPAGRRDRVHRGRDRGLRVARSPAGRAAEA